ncbi:MAG: GIY-YIG nuclease family protein [Cyanobacteriota bacterium]
MLQSLLDDPFVTEYRSVIHKVGVTVGDIKKRTAHAAKDPTYLLTDIEVVVVFQVINIHAQKLQTLLHKFFRLARLTVQLPDCFGIPVTPRE